MDGYATWLEDRLTSCLRDGTSANDLRSLYADEHPSAPAVEGLTEEERVTVRTAQYLYSLEPEQLTPRTVGELLAIISKLRLTLAPRPRTPESAESVARRFHEAYERLAPSFGYETRKASAVPWNQVPENNRALMIAVAAEVLGARTQEPEAASDDTKRLDWMDADRGDHVEPDNDSERPWMSGINIDGELLTRARFASLREAIDDARQRAAASEEQS